MAIPEWYHNGAELGQSVTGVTGEQAEVAVVRNVSLRAAARSALTR
jgi:hypothetical protein